MATIIQKKKFANEQKLLKNEPMHYITSYPDEESPLTWYFIIKGQIDTEYQNGEYIGKIVHSPKYPAEPPDYYMLTPNGRFEVNKKICLSNSSYHKGEWTSAWNIKTILIAFYSIFLDDKDTGISHIKKTAAERKVFADSSIEYNIKNHNVIYSKFDFENLHDGSKKNTVVCDKKEDGV
jgi:ubiquitin-protein ligase